MPSPLASRLAPLQASPVERVGLVLKDGTIVELPNISGAPAECFLVDPMDMLAHEEEMVATWHTHPRTSSALSTDDYQTYLMWPELLHIVVGSDGVKGYLVVNGAVVNDASQNHPAWNLEEAAPG